MITKLNADSFTAFRSITVDFSPGINIIIGENGTGKTHILKVLYAGCSTIDTRNDKDIAQKLKAIFLPNTIGRLVRRTVGRSSGSIKIFRKNPGEEYERTIQCRITSLNKVENTKRLW